MIILCPTCDNPVIIIQPRQKDDHTTQCQGGCSICKSIFAVEIKELRATLLTLPDLEARRAHTS